MNQWVKMKKKTNKTRSIHHLIKKDGLPVLMKGVLISRVCTAHMRLGTLWQAGCTNISDCVSFCLLVVFVVSYLFVVVFCCFLFVCFIFLVLISLCFVVLFCFFLFSVFILFYFVPPTRQTLNYRPAGPHRNFTEFSKEKSFPQLL